MSPGAKALLDRLRASLPPTLPAASAKALRTTLLAMKGPKAAEEIAAIDPRRRKRFAIEVVPIETTALSGHCVVIVRRA